MSPNASPRSLTFAAAATVASSFAATAKKPLMLLLVLLTAASNANADEMDNVRQFFCGRDLAEAMARECSGQYTSYTPGECRLNNIIRHQLHKAHNPNGVDATILRVDHSASWRILQGSILRLCMTRQGESIPYTCLVRWPISQVITRIFENVFTQNMIHTIF